MNLTTTEEIISRLNITNKLDINTPIIVMKEIIDSHGIDINISEYKISKVIKIINESSGYKINKNYENDIYSLQVIVRYINPNCKWPKKQLLKAFNFLKTFDNRLNIPEANFEYGIQKPENIYSLNCCILYALCKKYNIRTYSDMTIDDMYHYIKIISDNTYYNTIKNQLLINITNNDISKENFINILQNSNFVNCLNDNDIHVICMNDIKDILKKWKDNDSIPDQPMNDIEAVCLAYINFNIDISFVKSPMKEYGVLNKMIYYPCDIEMMKRLSKCMNNPYNFKNPYINKIFNPNLPEECYKLEDLRKFCVNEGYSQDEINDDRCYSLMRNTFMRNNFYMGLQDDLISEYTLYEENVNELNAASIICYGIYGRSLKVYTYEILNDIFTRYGRFRNTDTNKDYEDRLINKLRNITKKSKHIGETRDEYLKRQKLCETMNNINNFIKSITKNAETFETLYSLSKENEKKYVMESLNLLMECAMYMRGWDGSGAYPLKDTQTMLHLSSQSEVDVRVTESLIRFEKLCDKINNKSLNVKYLSLMFYDGEKFTPSTDRENGYNINDRLLIIKNGEQGSMKSCIRMSSNCLCASAYYYLSILGNKPSFNISELMNIT